MKETPTTHMLSMSAIFNKMSPYLLFLAEFSRYLHSNLDKPLQDYRFEEDLDDDLREMWAKNLPWNGKVCTVLCNDRNFKVFHFFDFSFLSYLLPLKIL